MYRAVLIDDEPYTLEDMQASFPFAKYGFTVAGTYTSAEDALAPILSDPPDLIITDIRMQTTTGLELAAICRKNNVQSVMILLSGYQDFDYVQEAFRQGIFFYMLKPIDDEEANDVLRRVYHTLQEHPIERKRKYTDDAFGKALEYYQQSADEGEPVAYARLGDLYRDGNGVEADAEKAAEYYRQAVEMGYEEAQESLDKLTEEGN